MFKIDTGDTGGSLGPWLSWSSNGSAMKRIEPKSWVCREKDEAGEKVEYTVPAFFDGMVMDLDTLKLGWERDGGKGQAPERRWNPSVEQATPRPDESKKFTGGYAWSNALSVRVLGRDGVAFTWEQGSFGAYRGFSELVKQIVAEHPEDGTLPLVKQTGVYTMDLGGGSSSIPILKVEKWVRRPDGLKSPSLVIATGNEAAPRPQGMSSTARAAHSAQSPGSDQRTARQTFEDDDIPF